MMVNWSSLQLPQSCSPWAWKRSTRLGKNPRFIIFGLVVLVVVLSGLLASHPKSRGYFMDFYSKPKPEGEKKLDELSEHQRKILALGPPDHHAIREYEKTLPQHNLNLPLPEGKGGRYVKFSNQIRMLGWNNCFNEVLMNAHLAYMSGRAYVFQDYVWKWDYYPWPPEQFLENPPRTPLNAIISGPTAGGLWEEGDGAPRSITEDWFEVVCPQSERRVINTRDVKPAVYWEPGNVIFEHWRKLLTEAPERCIEIWPASREEDGYGQTFDLWLWGTDRILPLWEQFVNSPTSRLLGTSPLVNSAIDRNEYLFFPHGPRNTKASHNPWDRMMAMHVRRGDYSDACKGLATWNSTFYSWNLLPFLPDLFVPPPGGEWGKNTPENEAAYLVHCLPTFDFIVQKVRDSRRDYIAEGAKKGENRELDIMYLLTNDQGEFLDKLKRALMADGWHTIRTSKDLVLDQDQTDVSMAVDMDIARRAAVFIGNGWSSFTSNINHRRLKDGKEPISIRFF
ncbi:hypothetical protein PM082_023727 [Marasmius tenuissimus]|nr:hypothetical protein PM082_023727 [Marasmius tenuissimus]